MSLLRKIIIRAGIILLALFLLYFLFTNLGLLGNLKFNQGPEQIILDCDTGNELDDLYAILRAVTSEELKVMALTSTHWYNHPNAGDTSMQFSYRLNKKLLELLNRTDIPLLKGATRPIGYWGENQPQVSEASSLIRKAAREAGTRNKLNVVCTGNVTNLATVLLQEPELAANIRCYLMAAKYDPEERVWNKNAFNVRNDLDAFDLLLNTMDLEMHIMTATTSRVFVMNRRQTELFFESYGRLGDLFIRRWQQVGPENDTWIFWDLALIEALIHPEFATEKEVFTPPENTKRKVWVYTRINEEVMIDMFFMETERNLNAE